MSLLVLACEKKFWQDVLGELAASGIKISHSVAHYRTSSQPRYFFENNSVEIIDGKMFYRLKDLEALSQKYFGNNLEPLSKEIIDYFTPVERDFYILTDRYCYFPVSFRLRKRIFREGLRFFLTFYKNNEISAVFTTCSPHNFGDYFAYHVAKYYNIPVLQTAHTMINDHVILRRDYREEEKVPEEFLSNKSNQDIESEIPKTLFKSAFSESRVLQYVIAKNQASQKLKKEPNSVLPKFKKAANRLTSNFGKKAGFKGSLAMNKLNSKTYRRILRYLDVKWQKRQSAYHDSLVTAPKPGEKYIYFAMHLQPERTSTPEAGIFEDHLLAIQILAAAMPEGWKLYVKENPRQFGRINIFKGRHYRGKTDYEDIIKLPNTYVLTQKIPSKEIMADAAVVSTLSGSIGWEALKSGKPCITFAPSWYGACRSSFKVENVEECKAAILAITIKTADQVHSDILKYLAFMKDKFSVGNLGDEAYIKNLNISYQEHVKLLAKSLSIRLS